MILDLRTMGILSAITPFMLGVIMLIYLRERKVYGGFGHWVLASFGFGLGNLLVLLRGVVPDLFSIIIGNVANVYSEILVYEGIQLFYGRRPYSTWNYVILAVYIVLQTYFTYFDPNINARIILVSATFFLLILRSGGELFRCGLADLTRTSRAAANIFFVTALFPLARGIYAALQTKPLDLFQDALSSWFSLTLMISIIAWTFYFFFLNSARLELDFELARRHLELIAMTDALTNSYNRRHFDEHAEIEFQRAKRFDKNLSFIMLDMDHFKAINDTHGHEMGDKVLLSIATTLEAQVRSFDVVARYGGDEFIIMLLNTDDEQAYAVAERIRRAVEATPIVGAFGELSMSLSLGVASVTAEDTDLAMTLRRADTALYQAKHEGRNRVVMI